MYKFSFSTILLFKTSSSILQLIFHTGIYVLQKAISQKKEEEALAFQIDKFCLKL